jgi:hypothetical protein
VRKTLLGIIIGILITAILFLIQDFITIETKVPKNHVTVRVEIKTDKSIDKLTLISTYSKQTIELSGQTETVFIYPNPGEGEFKICCFFKDGTELCSKGDYVEGGYSPKLEIRDNQIETVEFY